VTHTVEKDRKRKRERERERKWQYRAERVKEGNREQRKRK